MTEKTLQYVRRHYSWKDRYLLISIDLYFFISIYPSFYLSICLKCHHNIAMFSQSYCLISTLSRLLQVLWRCFSEQRKHRPNFSGEDQARNSEATVFYNFFWWASGDFKSHVWKQKEFMMFPMLNKSRSGKDYGTVKGSHNCYSYLLIHENNFRLGHMCDKYRRPMDGDWNIWLTRGG